MIFVLGIPFDDESSFQKGARKGPPAIRNAFRSESSNTCAENEIDVGACESIRFVDDLVFGSADGNRDVIETRIGKLLVDSAKVVSLGGDHSVTFPILKAYAAKYGQLNLLQLDAHPDLYDHFEGNPYSHACPFARAHESQLIKRHVQLGIRTMNPDQRKQADRYSVEVIEMRDWQSKVSQLVFEGPTYLTLDLDVLDPAYAPGISHYEPGGANVRQVIDVLQHCRADLVGADIVELNPDRDFQGMTAMVAAKFLKELLARMLT